MKISNLLYILSFVVCTVALSFALLHANTETNPFITAHVRRGYISRSIVAGGTIEPANLVSVGAQVSGRVIELHAKLGQEVTEGERIAEIDPTPQINAVEVTEAAYTTLQAQRARVSAVLRQTELAFRRQSAIMAGNAGARQDYEVAEAAHQGAKADLAALDAQIRGAAVSVRRARSELGYTQIAAPITGTVVAIITKKGQTVISSQTAPTIVRLANLGTMSIKAKVSEADIGRLRPGMPVHFSTLAQPDRRYESVLRSIDPAPDQIAVEANSSNQAGSSNSSQSDNAAIYFNARFEISNEDGALKPLMTAFVAFVLDEAKDAVIVPSAALKRVGGKEALLRILGPGGRPQERRVRIGLTSGTDVQILDGVAPGEVVIVADGSDGMRAAAIRDRAR